MYFEKIEHSNVSFYLTDICIYDYGKKKNYIYNDITIYIQDRNEFIILMWPIFSFFEEKSIHIYIYRERERQTDRQTDKTCKMSVNRYYLLSVSMYVMWHSLIRMHFHEFRKDF